MNIYTLITVRNVKITADQLKKEKKNLLASIASNRVKKINQEISILL